MIQNAHVTDYYRDEMVRWKHAYRHNILKYLCPAFSAEARRKAFRMTRLMGAKSHEASDKHQRELLR
jgi:hypothetical protein